MKKGLFVLLIIVLLFGTFNIVAADKETNNKDKGDSDSTISKTPGKPTDSKTDATPETTTDSNTDTSPDSFGSSSSTFSSDDDDGLNEQTFKKVSKEELTQTFLTDKGEEVEITVRIETREKDGKIYQKIKIRNYEVSSELELEQDDKGGRSKINAILSNGNKREIKIMPDTASQVAIDKLQSKNFTVILKEIGKNNDSKVVYEAEGNKTVKILGLFKVEAQIRVVIDAETGEILELEKPWWYFLAFGKGIVECGLDNLNLCEENECSELGSWYNNTCNLLPAPIINDTNITIPTNDTNITIPTNDTNTTIPFNETNQTINNTNSSN